MTKFLNIAGFIVGLIGLIIGLFSYIDTVKTKEISYNAYSPSFKIYDNEVINDASSLNVSLEDSIKINQNIYMTTYSIWNSGDLPIEKKDVRSDIEIRFKGINRLINYKIIKEVENGVSNFVFTKKNDSTFTLDWKFFDPKNGIKVQLLYFGNEKVTTEIHGNIFDVKFKEFIPFQNKKNSKFHNLNLNFVIIMTVLVWLYSAFRIIIKGIIKIGFTYDFYFTLVFPIIYTFLTVLSIYIYYYRIQEMPF